MGEVGPHSGDHGDPIGGNLMFLAGTEYAFPLIAKSQGVIFCDTGTVVRTGSVNNDPTLAYPNGSLIGNTGYRASVGFEVRIPFDFLGSVPLTLGLAIPVSSEPGDVKQQFYFTFGAAF